MPSFAGRGLYKPVSSVLGKFLGTCGALCTRCLKGLKSSGRPFARQPRPKIISQDREKFPSCVFNELHAIHGGSVGEWFRALVL